MPTSYTAPIHEGYMSFEEFVWRCARNFGALINYRDEPLDAPISLEPRSSYSSYDAKCVAELEEELAEAETLSDEEWDWIASEQNRHRLEMYETVVRDKLTLKSRYGEMLDKVLLWEPPTADHAGLKRFMVEQLEMSIEGDCSLPPRPTPQTGKQEKEWEIEYLTGSLERAKKSSRLSQENTQGRSEWLKQLDASVPLPAKLRKE